MFMIFCPLQCLAENAISPSQTGTKDFSIGVLYWSMNIPGQVAMRHGVETAIDKINTQAAHSGQPLINPTIHVAGDGNVGIENQIRQMSQLVEQNVDLILVQPTDIAALRTGLLKANQKGIPVVAYDQHILGGKLASFITSDNYQAGFYDGEYIAANFPAEQVLNIILVEYPHVSSTVSRIDGLIDALETYQQSYQIIKTYIAVEPFSGSIAARDILQDFPEKGTVDVVFTVNDGGGLEILNALEAAGRTEIFFASVDGDPRVVANIKKGGISRIDSAQFCAELGAEALRISYQVLLGNPVPSEVLIPVFPITRETVKRYKGWNAPLPEPFIKPWHSLQKQWTGEAVTQ